MPGSYDRRVAVTRIDLSNDEISLILDALQSLASSREGAMLEKEKQLKHLKTTGMSLQVQIAENEDDVKSEQTALDALRDSHATVTSLMEDLGDKAAGYTRQTEPNR